MLFEILSLLDKLKIVFSDYIGIEINILIFFDLKAYLLV